MTNRQREILSAMEPGLFLSAASVAARCTATQRGALGRLWMLEDRGYVERRGSEFTLTKEGAALARTLPPPSRKSGKPQLPSRQRVLRIERTGKPAPSAKPKRKKIRTKSFSQKYKDPDGKRYGGLFLRVRVLRCWLEREGYRGRGHPACGPGVQGGHTAHHLGRNDEDGLIPGCGAAHDLYAGLGGNETQEEFKGWLRAGGVTLAEVGQAYVNDARIVRRPDDEDLAW